MTTALLRVPRYPQTVRAAWLPLYGPAAAHVGSDISVSSAYYNGTTYFGFVDGDGNTRVASFNHSTGSVAVSPVLVSVGSDVHCSPSVLIRSSDHKIVVASCRHNVDAHMYVNVSTNAEDVTSFGAAIDIGSTLAGASYTYPNLFQVSGESGKIYLFYRDQQSGTNVLCYSTSTDGGATWTAQTALYKNAGKQSYWVITSDDTSRIDFCVDDGSASLGDTASAYHFFYTGGSFFKSDGATISVSKPYAPSNVTKIYDGAANGSVRVPYSIVGGATPVIALAAWDPAGSGQPEKYWYVTYNGTLWSANEIDTSGSTPSSSFSEGGMAVDRIDITIVYVSRAVSGNWQVFKYQTPDGGVTWTNTQLSTDIDQPNLRPITPRNANARLRALWCYGPHYAIAATGVEPSPALIRGYPNTI